MTYDEAIAVLRASPLFNSSLASKELFHSNFIAWLMEVEPLAVGVLFAEAFGKEAAHWQVSDSQAVKREYKHLDLVVSLGEGQGTLIVENKIKSIPMPGQLRDYSSLAESFSGPRFKLLLTLGASDVSHLDLKEWRHLTYHELAPRLNTIADRLKSTYYAELVRDEARTVSALAVLADESDYKWPPSSIKERRLRVHDLIGKRSAHAVRERLVEAIRNLGARVHREEDSALLVVPVGDWRAYSGLTRGSALVGLLTRLGLDVVHDGRRYPVVVGIQVQGRQLRHYVEFISNMNGPKSSPLRSLAGRILAESPVRGWGLAANGPNSRTELCTYGERFFYRYELLDAVTETDVLVERTMNAVFAIHSDRTRLQSQLVAAARDVGLIANVLDGDDSGTPVSRLQ